MALGLHNRKSTKESSPKKRLGRGYGSGKGTYSARGLKGQKARSGGKSGLALKGMKANIQNIPKLPGFTSPQPKMETVQLSALESNFKNGDKITPEALKKKGLVETTKNGVKIIGKGKLNSKFTVLVDKVSSGAKEAITTAGGSVKEFSSETKASESTEKSAE